MRKRWSLVAAIAAAGFAGGATAAPYQVYAVLSLQIPGVTPITVQTCCPTLEASGTGSRLDSLQLSPGFFAAAGLSPSVDPTAFPIAGAVATFQNGSGSLARTVGGAFGGVVPLLGVARICLYAACDSNPIANLSVPISPVGQGGTGVATAGGVAVTVRGAPWTTGTVGIGSATTHGSVAGFFGGTSTTLDDGGYVQLVTPIFISTNISVSPTLAAFAAMRFQFIVPEPSTLALLASGVAGLVALGRARSRAR